MTRDEAKQRLKELGIPGYIRQTVLARYKSLPVAEYELASIELDAAGALILRERIKYLDPIELHIIEAKRITKE